MVRSRCYPLALWRRLGGGKTRDCIIMQHCSFGVLYIRYMKNDLRMAEIVVHGGNLLRLEKLAGAERPDRWAWLCARGHGLWWEWPFGTGRHEAVSDLG